MAFEQYNQVCGNVPEGLDTPKTNLERLFADPAPSGWVPKYGEQVYIRPGMTFGGSRLDRATVTDTTNTTVGVKAQIGRKLKMRRLLLTDVRPI